MAPAAAAAAAAATVTPSSSSISVRGLVVVALVFAWAVRLTWNWVSHWDGLDHEDWRYPMVKKSFPPLEPLIDLVALHVYPTIQVCCDDTAAAADG